MKLLIELKKKIINIKDINKLPKKIKKNFKDIKNICKQKKILKIKISDIPILMGIVNITPDSFSDGGKYNNKNLAKKHINKLISMMVQK